MTQDVLASGRLELIAFGISGQEFCIDITVVREIRDWTPATPLPNPPCLFPHGAR